ncbi:GFA family protein [Shewanella sp. NIFS-20-20]|uniref:GFA family protein n=1 Tax=Shewanella sp. NIFS-20-20 TaxID=2853806 RepID=UPI001C46E2CD|nr:GFA family protein [Shewanella sp. NIFS-20-20]MBV7315319.1 GFA family protein [Shewanella sp. NIFS-20-20]
MKIEGGCLCGAIRYCIDATPIDAGCCHCHRCQKSSGAPVLAWLTIPFSGFTYTAGVAGSFASSPEYLREFCRDCGTQIAFRLHRNPSMIDITICSLDDSSAIRLDYHIWCQSQVSWLAFNDDLPKYEDAGPDGA